MEKEGLSPLFSLVPELYRHTCRPINPLDPFHQGEGISTQIYEGINNIRINEKNIDDISGYAIIRAWV